MSVIRLKATDGSEVSFEDKMIGQGGMKDVYFSPDRSYVLAFFRKKQDANSKDRLQNIVGPYRDKIFNQVGGDYWKHLFCWPTKIVEYEGRVGVVVPVYQEEFFFKHGSQKGDCLALKGKEKEGKWFASAYNQKLLDDREKGDYRSYFKICILISRAMRRMHIAGLAHSDLSYKNVLVDPSQGNASIIDIDGLVVPGKYPPDVVGTPDFIAPEVMRTMRLQERHPSKAVPRRETDCHALAVLIYMYLLYRHPLKGRKVHDTESADRDEELSMGEKALFIENPADSSNRPDAKWLSSNYRDRLAAYMPWIDVDRIPYGVLGPYLKTLFDRAFIDGLHDPAKRPGANDWEVALVKTVDLMQPCQNPHCTQKWFVFDNTRRPACPFCQQPFRGLLPILNLYSNKGHGRFMPDNHRLMVYHNQYLYSWHANSRMFPSEKLTDAERKGVGYFVQRDGIWYFVNQSLATMKDLTADKPVPVNSMIALREGMQLMLSAEEGGRLVQIQMVDS